MINKWDQKYKDLKSTSWYKKILSKNNSVFLAYGETTTYIKAAEFLKSCQKVEDWGSGMGQFKVYRPDAICIDGSDGVSDIKADLTKYRSKVDGIHLRHVLEHNIEWQKILENIFSSATKKIAITLFIPLSNEETDLIINAGEREHFGIPDIKISKKLFLKVLKKHADKIKNIRHIFLKSKTQYGQEEMFLFELN